MLVPEGLVASPLQKGHTLYGAGMGDTSALAPIEPGRSRPESPHGP